MKTKKHHGVRNAAAAAIGAVQAQRQVKDDLKAATDSYSHSLTGGIGFLAGAGVLAVAAAAVLTVGFVVWLNGLLGSPAGYFLTVVGYLVIAGILAMGARRLRSHHKQEAREHLEDARYEIRHAARPLKAAFQKDGR